MFYVPKKKADVPDLVRFPIPLNWSQSLLIMMSYTILKDWHRLKKNNFFYAFLHIKKVTLETVLFNRKRIKRYLTDIQPLHSVLTDIQPL